MNGCYNKKKQSWPLNYEELFFIIIQYRNPANQTNCKLVLIFNSTIILFALSRFFLHLRHLSNSSHMSWTTNVIKHLRIHGTHKSTQSTMEHTQQWNGFYYIPRKLGFLQNKKEEVLNHWVKKVFQLLCMLQLKARRLYNDREKGNGFYEFLFYTGLLVTKQFVNQYLL